VSNEKLPVSMTDHRKTSFYPIRAHACRIEQFAEQ
jgi:hypothetical protein